MRRRVHHRDRDRDAMHKIRYGLCVQYNNISMAEIGLRHFYVWYTTY